MSVATLTCADVTRPWAPVPPDTHAAQEATCPTPTVATHRCRVLAHRAVNARYRYLRLQADAPVALTTQPGQFYQLKCPVTDSDAPFLLRPMSVYGTGPEPDTIEFLYNVTGVGTRALATLPEGATLDIVGPLGNTFTLNTQPEQWQRVMLVARGVGLATMAPLVQRAAAAGLKLTVVMSARSEADLMRDEFLRSPQARALADVHCVFDTDGSSAVEALAPRIRALLDATPHDAVYTCGSHRLLMLLQRVLHAHPHITAEVAMEQRMACGMGVCLSCVRLFDRDGDKQFLRVCREGPVFPIRDVVGEVDFG
ncbi:dihydroorotate dehydrogenase electron transfer subunit [Pandoraea communis]|uniref:Dihydroorotate dehydrogenase electron transfer subunit n=1 Tax=Pandoraea communis TaxID=2508297 RepID=A0A5E4UWT1_9BURK|nr:dihydroorotate dehydrogenase electron transfer subunit [Pandoraea communis]VVE04366.1 dihydroorotate dehydrogenase electron transfer subunit [Pandoraea communis]